MSIFESDLTNENTNIVKKEALLATNTLDSFEKSERNQTGLNKSRRDQTTTNKLQEVTLKNVVKSEQVRIEKSSKVGAFKSPKPLGK